MNSPFRKPRFSVQTLLWILFVVAAFFAGVMTTRVSAIRYMNWFLYEDQAGGSSHFEGLELAQSTFSYSKLSDCYFDGANLQEADLSYSSACGSFFRGADLRNANLDYCVLADSDFTDADLRGASLKNCVALADFRGAKLEGAKFSGSVFDGQFDASTTYSSATRFPKGFNPVRHGLTLVKDEADRTNGRGREQK